MLAKIATTLVTGVAGALAGLVLGFAFAGPGGWLGPMPEVAAIMLGTVLAVLGLAVGVTLSLLSSYLEYLRDYLVAGVVACLVINLVLSLGTGGPTDASAFLQVTLLGAYFGSVYKFALSKFSKMN